MQPKIVHGEEAVILNVLGVEHVIYVRGDDTRGTVLFAELHIPADKGIPPHIHTREDEIFHVLEGDVTFTIEDHETTLGPRSTVFGPRCVSHGFRAAGGRSARMLVTIAPSGLEAMFEELAHLPPVRPDMTRVVEIVGRYGVSFV